MIALTRFSRDFYKIMWKYTTKWSNELENGTRRAQISRKPLMFPSPNKQTNKQPDKQKTLSTQRFKLSSLTFIAQCSYRLSYRAVLIWLLLSDYYYQITIIRLLLAWMWLKSWSKNPTSSSWEILLTNKQTNKQTHEGDCNIPLFAG